LLPIKSVISFVLNLLIIFLIKLISDSLSFCEAFSSFFSEITIVISEMKKVKNVSQKLSESDKDLIRKTINKLSVREIVSLIGKKGEISKKAIYNFCIELKNEN